MNNVNNDKIEIWNCKKTVTTFVKEIFCSNSFFWNFFKYIKKSKDSSAKYYQAKKERLLKKPVKDIKVFLKKKKKKKQQYGGERYKNLSEDEKQKLIV